MPIEPHAVRFQVGAIVMPHHSKTENDYEASMRRKYGKIPSMAELAAMENKTVSRSINIPNEHTKTMTEAQRHRVQSIRKAMAAKKQANLDRIFACLTEPKTAAQIEAEVHLSRRRVGAHLRAAFGRGEVNRVAMRRMTLWSKVE